MTKKSPTAEAMTLEQAISLLCGVHLKALEFDDWQVRMGATPETPWDREGYVEAWSVLRDHLLKSRIRIGMELLLEAENSNGQLWNHRDMAR